MVMFNKPTSHLSKADKKESKERKLREKERERKYNNLIDNYKSMNKFMVNPNSIKIGCLEKCVESKIVKEAIYNGTCFGHIIEKYESIPGQKVLIELKPNSELYVDIDEINSNKDLEEIRSQIHIDGITLGGKILSCTSGKIRVNRESLQAHPSFENSNTKVSIKELKKIVAELRK